MECAGPKRGTLDGHSTRWLHQKTDEHGRKYIALKQPQAGIIRWAFLELAKGIFSIDQVRKECNRKGLKCSRSNFWYVIRNPVYCGKIRVSAYKDEESAVVDGQHEPLVSEAVFNEVQEVIMGRKRKLRTKTQISVHEAMPLRGFLICPRCGRMLTGSASKGRDRLYYYYHCTSPCGCRFGTEKTNALFIHELRKYVPRPGMLEIYLLILKEAFAKKIRT